MKSTAKELGPSKPNSSPAKVKIEKCFCAFTQQGCPHLGISVGLSLLLQMTDQGPQPYHRGWVLLPHTTYTFLQGGLLSFQIKFF